MKTYTVIYTDAEGTERRWDGQGTDAPHAFQQMRRELGIKPGTIEVQYQIQHHIPKVTVVLDGDMVQAAYSDSEVEILHCYADKEAVGNALDNGLSLMPGSHHCLNYPDKADHAYPFGWVDVDHNPEAVSFDHKFATDKEMIEEFTSAVREELES